MYRDSGMLSRYNIQWMSDDKVWLCAISFVRFSFVFSLAEWPLVRVQYPLVRSTSWVSWSLKWRHNGRDGVPNPSHTIVSSAVYSGADQRKHQSSASLAFVREIHRWPMNSPHKWPVTRKMFPCDDVIMMTEITAHINSLPNIANVFSSVYLSWLCVWGACVIILCQLLHVDPVKVGVLFPLLPCGLWCVHVCKYMGTWLHGGRIRLFSHYYPDSKVHGANMGPTWVLSAPDGPHVGPMNLTIRVYFNIVI